MTGPDNDHPEVSIHPPTLFIAALIIGYIIRIFAGGWLPLPNAIAEGLGGILLMTGLVVAVSSVSAFAESGETLRPSTPSGQLFTEGMFKYSRNPIYLALVVFGVGFGVATLNLWIVLTTIGAGAIINFLVIPEEERYLARRFGEQFEAYRQRTRRWI